MMQVADHFAPAPKNRGAALLAAMLTLTLVATLAAGAAWQQWRGVETERAERDRAQAAWLLWGALDWTRLILREDARSGGADHLGEPWALPLQESRLSSFLAADASSAVLLADQANDDVFLSGQIQDLQSRLNVSNLVQAGSNSAALLVWSKLFDSQGLDMAELNVFAGNLRKAFDLSTDSSSGASAPIQPQRLDQLTLLGLSSASLERLRPFIIWLPERTKINVNTASAEVLYASVAGLDLDGARKIVAERDKQRKAHYETLTQVGSVIPLLAGLLTDSNNFSTESQFFEVTGRLRLVDGKRSVVVTERSVVKRVGRDVKTLWRERGSFPIAEGGQTVEQLSGSRR
jgi:general secretion pathway protein K